jgi:hypothetical protein
LAQDGGVVAGPAGHGAVAGALGAGGLDALFTGGGRMFVGVGVEAQIAAFGRLAAGQSKGWGEVGPRDAKAPGGADQLGFPPGELVSQPTQRTDRRQQLGPVDTGPGLLFVGLLGFGIGGWLGGEPRHHPGEMGHRVGQRQLRRNPGTHHRCLPRLSCIAPVKAGLGWPFHHVALLPREDGRLTADSVLVIG